MTTSPPAILRAVRSFARGRDLFQPGPLVVAVSGGTDSCALLVLLADLADELGLVPLVAHFDHRLRPRASAADAAFVADLASRFGAPVRIARAERAPASEDAARRGRYAFLRRVAEELGATAIATGHTRDDQAETVLLHIARGSGLPGLAAMRPSRDGVVRPLLAIGRAETSAVCAAAGIVAREDPSNRSLRFARNRVRRRVLPELRRINPQVSEALARLAESAAVATDALSARARAALAEASAGVGIDLDRLAGDAEVRSEALALAWHRATGRALAARHRDALARESARRDGSARLDLPGGQAVREYAHLRFVPTAMPPASADAAAAATPPAAPGQHARGGDAGTPAHNADGLVEDRVVRWQGWELLLTRGPLDAERWPLRASPPEALAEGLSVRARRPGDRLEGGMRTKVQDVLTDAKVPARIRATYPLVVTASGAVWWVPGVAEGAAAGSSRWTLAARPPDRPDQNILWSPNVRQVASSRAARKDGPQS